MRELRSILGSDARQLDRFVVLASAFGILRGLAMGCLVPLAPALLGVTQSGDWTPFWTWFLVLVSLTALSALAHYGQAMAAFEVALTLLTRLQGRIGDHLVTLPLGWFGRGRAAEAALLATKGVDSTANASAHMISPLVSGVASAVTVLGCTLALDWRLGLALLICAPVLLIGHRFSTRLADRADERDHAARRATNERVLEFARCQPVLRASGRSDSYAPLEDSIECARRVSRSLLWYQVSAVAIGGILVQVTLAVAVTVAALIALGGELDPGRLIGLLTLCLVFSQPLSVTFDYGVGLRKALLSSRRIAKLLATEPLPAAAAPVHGTPRRGEVELREVGFSYRQDSPVLQGVSLIARPGTMTALVGPSGSGKTTITRLIARFHDTDSGSVLVGGVDVREQRTEDLMRQLSLVFQETYLFDDTLRANILLGRAEATDQEIVEAARLTGVLEIVERLPDGWQTRVGEGGTLLSGGERQRIAIARALLKRADIVLLDEATSALDPENERRISETMQELARQSTLVVIAHKLNTIARADQIVMLTETGGVDDIGSHDQLIARCPRYAAFWQERDQARGWQVTR